jgi:hypothetical protein
VKTVSTGNHRHAQWGHTPRLFKHIRGPLRRISKVSSCSLTNTGFYIELIAEKLPPLEAQWHAVALNLAARPHALRESQKP